MPRFGRGEYLHQFRNDGPGERAAGNNGRELPPLRIVAAKLGDNQVRDGEGQNDGNNRGDPDQGSKRGFVVEVVGTAIARLGDGAIDEVRGSAGDEHDDAHDENPNQKLYLDRGIVHGQKNEGNQRDAGDAVGFKAVGAGTDRVTRIVTCAVGNNTGVARVVFLDFEDDLHQVGTDIGNLGEDAAGDAQRGCAQRFTDGKTDEAGTGVVARDEEKNEQHHEQFDRNEHHADAHAGFKRRVVDGIGLSAQAGEGGARVCEGIDADAEPCDAITAGDTDDAEKENDGQRERDGLAGYRREPAEVEDDDDGNENPEQHQELALRQQIGLAGFVDELGNVAHRFVYGKIFETRVDDEPEEQAEDADKNAPEEELVAVHAPDELNRGKIGQLQAGFAARFAFGLGGQSPSSGDQCRGAEGCELAESM